MESINPLVTVIVTTFNCEKYIGVCLDSVLSQSYKNIEIIVVDDFSTDSTLNILNDFNERFNTITIVKLEKNNGGPAKPRNIGIELSKGEFISFLDGDDFWHPNKLELQINLFLERGIIFSSTQMHVFRDFNGSMLSLKRDIKTTDYDYRMILRKNRINLSSVLIKKDIFQLERFREEKDFVAVEDYDLWLRLLKIKKLKCTCILQPLVYYRVHDLNISGKKIAHVKKVIKILKMHSKIYFFYLFVYAFKSFFRSQKTR